MTFSINFILVIRIIDHANAFLYSSWFRWWFSVFKLIFISIFDDSPRRRENKGEDVFLRHSLKRDCEENAEQPNVIDSER